MKTRVLHVIDSFDLGGGQTVVLNLLKYADRILSLLKDAQRADAIATAAGTKVRAEYSADVMTRRVEAIYSRYLPGLEGDPSA